MNLATEVRETLKLAVPLVVGQMAAVGMAATDILFAGNLGARSLTAVAVSLNFDVMVLVLMMGVFMASAAVVAQRRGAGSPPKAIGAYIRSTLRLALALGLFCNALIYLTARPVITWLVEDQLTVEMAVSYLHAYSFSSVSICFWYALRFAAEGTEGSKPVLVAGLVGLVVNAIANPLLIYGYGPFPALGVAGSAWSTVIAYTAMPLSLAWSYRSHPALKGLGLFAGRSFEPKAERLLMQAGLPVGFILAAEAGLFVLVSVLMTRMGDTAVAAHQIALNVATIFFMIPVGIGLASTVRVGYAVGAGDRLAARRAGLVGMGVGAVSSVVSALLMMTLGGVIAAFYTQNGDIARLAASLLWVGGIFQIADGLQTTANSALRGLSDTRMPLQMTLFGFWVVGMPMAWVLAFHMGYGALGLWWGITAGITSVAVLLVLRFLACTSEPAPVLATAPA